MKTKNLILILSLFFLPAPPFIYGQDCNCKSDFEWVKKTFEENDAGFLHILNMKGRDAYEIHNQIFQEKIDKITNPTECTKTIYEWLTFFRKGHIGIQRLKYPENTNTQKEEEKEIIRDIKEVSIEDFTKYLDGKGDDPGYEGIWQMGTYKLAIKKEGNSWVGRVVETTAKDWFKGEKKLEIIEKGKKSDAIYWDGSHNLDTVNNVKMWGKTMVRIPMYATLKRTYPKMEMEEDVKSFMEILSNDNASIKNLSDNTLLLRISSFEISEKSHIDSIINANLEKILSTENLIIDVRYNGGGSDYSYESILPILYTSPIRNVGVEFLCTPLNIKMLKDVVTNPEFIEMLGEEELKKFEGYYQKAQKHVGEFVNIFQDEDISYTTFDTIHPYPKRVGILINDVCGSTTEQFILDAKQSAKVKLFGISTSGSLDISNLNEATSPCGDFKLIYGLTKSLRIPGMMIDDIGIQPDYFLDEGIPEYKWIEYVKNTLETK